ncbi:hypothetical protein GPECTOR_23g20 [Gonium pectorale]|uniref:Uncharacterized protein n=1 Tax=Gonium pectorale TaxID=33097 RepID=A0A150GGW8_GONPE|nr:hypothetical protein GPECTOR_23g20 [Gonium pectorale]|eukprot:KXZ49088.1 hypothetical protein GPECTOR_23g20 [Gonium pectorale]
MAAAGLPNHSEALAHLTWLREQGYPVDGNALCAAARTGNTAVAQYLVPEVQWAAAGIVHDVLVDGGHLAALQTLHAAGWPLHQKAHTYAALAAKAGHLHVLAWLLETLGAETVVLSGEIFTATTESGSVELLAWLQQHECPVNRDAYILRGSEGGL